MSTPFLWRRAAPAGTLGVFILATLTALWVAAPEADNPEPTAFEPGPSNATAWANAARGQGLQVHSLVSDLAVHKPATDGSGELIILLDPRRSLEPDEKRVLNRHLSVGGSVWVAGAADYVNDWLLEFGIAIAPNAILDPQSTDSTEVQLEAAELGIAVTGRGVGSLVIETGTWQPWLVAPERVHMDVNGNGKIDQSDPALKPPHNVVAAMRRLESGGHLAVTAQHDLFTDRAWRNALSRNPEFHYWALNQLLPDGGTVLVDESHHGWSAAEAPLVATVLAGTTVSALQPATRLAILAIVAAALLLPPFLAKRLDPFRPHSPMVPVFPSHAKEPLEPKLATEMAWQIVAARTGQDLNHLLSIGADEVAQGLTDDSDLARALRSQPLGTEERVRLYKSYLSLEGGRNQ